MVDQMETDQVGDFDGRRGNPTESIPESGLAVMFHKCLTPKSITIRFYMQQK
jgi:hypothetical protein